MNNTEATKRGSATPDAHQEQWFPRSQFWGPTFQQFPLSTLLPLSLRVAAFLLVFFVATLVTDRLAETASLEVVRQQSPPAQVTVKVTDENGAGLDSALVRLQGLNVPETYQGITGEEGSITFQQVNTPVRQQPTIPLEYRISQAWPNPSSQKTNILITTPRPEQASIQLYNILGQKILEEQARLNPGSYKATINMQGLSPGIYIARIKTSQGTTTRKITWLGPNQGQPNIQIHQQAKPTPLHKTTRQPATYQATIEKPGYLNTKTKKPTPQDTKSTSQETTTRKITWPGPSQGQPATYKITIEKPGYLNPKTKQPTLQDTVSISQDTTLTYKLEKNQPPTITWISPKKDTTLDNEDSLQVKIAIDDPNKQKITAQFYINQQYQGQTTITTPPETLQTTLKFQQATKDTTLQATITATDGQNTTTSTSPTIKIHPHPDVTITLKPLYNPQIDTSYTTPPPIQQGKIIIAQLDGTNVMHGYEYTLYELYDYADPIHPTLKPEKILDTLQVTDTTTTIPMEQGKNYRFIIQIPGYHEHITGNINLTANDTTLNIQLPDTTNLPLKHTSIVAYGGYVPGGEDHSAGIERILIPPDSVYISTLPAKGSGNPVPEEYIQAIKEVYEKDLQGNFMKTPLYPKGLLARTKIVIGDNPPPDGTPGVIIWKADDTIPFVAEFAHYDRGFAGCEIYSITIRFKTNWGNYPAKAIALHEAASLFNRNNSPGDDDMPSVFDIGSFYTELQRADKALLRWLFSRPLNPDLDGTPYYPNGSNLRYFDKMYR